MCCRGGSESRNEVLERQDLVIIREIVGEEIGSKTSDLRQDVSVLKQENSKKLDHLGVLMEDQARVMQLILENLSQNNKKIEEIPEMKNKIKYHEARIGNLELAVKRKLA